MTPRLLEAPECAEPIQSSSAEQHPPFRLRDMLRYLRDRPSFRVKFLEAGRWSERDSRRLSSDVRDAVLRLTSYGCRPGHRVGILGPNCYAWLVADLALLEIGCVSVALPEHLAEERGALAERFRLALLLIGRTLAGSEPLPGWVRYLDGPDERKLELRAEAIREDDAELEEPTLVFSSGTSGRLKCLRIRRRGIERVVASFTAAYPPERSDRLLVFLPLSNLQQRVMLYGAIWLGLDTVLVTPQQLFRGLKEGKPSIVIAPPLLYESIHARFLDAPAWKRALARLAVGLMGLMPQRARARVSKRLFGQLHEALGGRTRLMITGMAHIKRATLEFFNGVGLNLYEAYGLTECGIVCGNREGQLRIGSVGRPFDPDSVSVNEDGEIVVTKEHPLARGYLDEVDEQRVFEGDRRIRTGDLGHFDSDGYLYIDGRKKELLITSGGYKLHPELLEERIHACPLVDRAAAILSKNRNSVHAVITLRPGMGSAEQSEVNRYVQAMNQKLPEASRVAKVILRHEPFSVDDGTLTRNLKLNRTIIAASVGD